MQTLGTCGLRIRTLNDKVRLHGALAEAQRKAGDHAGDPDRPPPALRLAFPPPATTPQRAPSGLSGLGVYIIPKAESVLYVDVCVQYALPYIYTMGGSSMYTYPVVALSEWSDCMVDPGTHTQHMGQAPIAVTR